MLRPRRRTYQHSRVDSDAAVQRQCPTKPPRVRDFGEFALVSMAHNRESVQRIVRSVSVTYARRESVRILCEPTYVSDVIIAR